MIIMFNSNSDFFSQACFPDKLSLVSWQKWNRVGIGWSFEAFSTILKRESELAKVGNIRSALSLFVRVKTASQFIPSIIWAWTGLMYEEKNPIWHSYEAAYLIDIPKYYPYYIPPNWTNWTLKLKIQSLCGEEELNCFVSLSTANLVASDRTSTLATFFFEFR